ncbi:MAG: hypothetical protein JNK79_19110 [Chitinophagaceae bacterium]|nr:hypothetical protein [Chitinophagaceae bacterium]
MKNDQGMGLLTPKNNKGGKKNNKQKGGASAQGSQFMKQNSKPSGITKKPVKTGGARGS